MVDLTVPEKQSPEQSFRATGYSNYFIHDAIWNTARLSVNMKVQQEQTAIGASKTGTPGLS